MLPFLVAVLIPYWAVARNQTTLTIGATTPLQLLQLAGLALLCVGFGLFAGSLRPFATEGDGTLAPWDPPRRLVITGLYRYVRNPMITGVVAVLFGEAGVAIYIPAIEEPMLAGRFGEAYREYCRNVPRLVPRLRPWEPGRG